MRSRPPVSVLTLLVLILSLPPLSGQAEPELAFTLDPRTLLAVPASGPLRLGQTYDQAAAALKELYGDRLGPVFTPGFKGPGQGGWGASGGGSLIARAGTIDFELSFTGTKDESSLFRFFVRPAPGDRGPDKGPTLAGLALGDPFDKARVPAGAAQYFTLDKAGKVTALQILLEKRF